MDPDGAVDLTASPVQVSEREMRVDRLAVDFEHADEQLDRLVRLLVQEVVHAPEVVVAQLGLRGGALLAALAPHRGVPAGRGGDGKKEPQPVEGDHAHHRIRLPSCIPAASGTASGRPHRVADSPVASRHGMDAGPLTVTRPLQDRGAPCASRNVSPIFVARAPRCRGSGPHGPRGAEGRAGTRRSAGGASSRRAGKPGMACPACKRSRDCAAKQVADTTSKRLEGVRPANASRWASAAGNR